MATWFASLNLPRLNQDAHRTGEAPSKLEILDELFQQAIDVGLNHSAADTVIHLDPWWKSRLCITAIDRAYRIG